MLVAVAVIITITVSKVVTVLKVLIEVASLADSICRAKRLAGKTRRAM